MVNHQLRCIFIEIPKTASTSIREVVGQPVKPHLNLKQTRALLLHEARLTRRDDPARWVAGIMRDYFKFSIVRNPWDRVVSLYHRREGIQPSAHLSFAEFVDRLENASDTCIHPTTHRNQADWLKNGKGEMAMDFIGRFESLEDDWQTIAQKLGSDTALPHANRNQVSRKPMQDYYDDASRQRVAELFAEDIATFQYAFDENT